MTFAKLDDKFSAFTKSAAKWLGNSIVFGFAQIVVVVWMFFGPKFEWSDSFWNGANFYLSYVSYVMMFIIQNTQNRDSRALHLKLDEILRAIGEAKNDFRKAETLSESELKKLEETICS